MPVASTETKIKSIDHLGGHDWLRGVLDAIVNHSPLVLNSMYGTRLEIRATSESDLSPMDCYRTSPDGRVVKLFTIENDGITVFTGDEYVFTFEPDGFVRRFQGWENSESLNVLINFILIPLLDEAMDVGVDEFLRLYNGHFELVSRGGEWPSITGWRETFVTAVPLPMPDPRISRPNHDGWINATERLRFKYPLSWLPGTRWGLRTVDNTRLVSPRRIHPRLRPQHITKLALGAIGGDVDEDGVAKTGFVEDLQEISGNPPQGPITRSMTRGMNSKG